jgi:hypothetical protein
MVGFDNCGARSLPVIKGGIIFEEFKPVVEEVSLEL